jgi:tRNA uracil 4-sulfurtransferase
MHHPASILVATYAEIALKGRNRPMFQRRLANNMRTAVAGESVSSIKHVESRFLIHLDDPTRADAVITKLRRVFGLQWIAPAVAIPREEPDQDLARVSEIAVEMALRDVGNARTFKVDTKRSDRGFPLQSMEINNLVGFAVGAAIKLPARMTRPDFTVHVLVLRKSILVATAHVPASGGLPAGISGRVVCLLSGGIDSPVAAWLMMKRGCRPTLVHVHPGRNAEEADAGKIIELTRVLARYSPTPLTLYLVPVVPYEMRAIGAIDDRHDMVMFRRYIVKIAAALAFRERCLGLVTGDNLGQVASQTLHNLGAIAPDVTLPVYRPLIGLDKIEITALAETIGSFALSIQPYRDCCSIRSPRPVLNARPDTLLALSRGMDLDGAVQEAVAAGTRLVVAADA